MKKGHLTDRNSPNNPISDYQNTRWDPLGESWIGAFTQKNGKTPTDADRQDRLFSLLFMGKGDDGSWTSDDWTQYKRQKNLLWSGKEAWKAENTISNFDRFIVHLRRLADQYGNRPERASRFSRAVGLIWGGIAYDTWVAIALTRAAVGDHLFQLHEGTEGWITKYVDDANPAHHWAAAFLTGFYFGTVVGIVASTTRDVAQYLTGLGGTKEDISLGILGARHGGWFRRKTGNVSETGKPYLRLFSRMQRDLGDQL